MQSIQKFNGLRARPGRSVPSKQPDTGRQAVSWDEIAEKAQRLRAQNLSFKSIAAALGVEEVTLRKGLRAFGVVLPVVTRMPKPKAKQPHRGRRKPVGGEPIGAGGLEFSQTERQRVAVYIASQRDKPRKLLSPEQLAEIAAENAAYTPLTKRIPARGVRGWSAAAPVSPKA